MQVGAPRDLYEKPKNPFVADFIGINNLIPGEIQGIDSAGRGMKVQTRIGPLICSSDEPFKTGDRCMITVRPETASISQSEDTPEGFNGMGGTVSFAYYSGNTIRYDVEVGSDAVFKVDIQNPWYHQTLPLGEKVHISFPQQITLGIPIP